MWELSGFDAFILTIEPEKPSKGSSVLCKYTPTEELGQVSYLTPRLIMTFSWVLEIVCSLASSALVENEGRAKVGQEAKGKVDEDQLRSKSLVNFWNKSVRATKSVSHSTSSK